MIACALIAGCAARTPAKPTASAREPSQPSAVAPDESREERVVEQVWDNGRARQVALYSRSHGARTLVRRVSYFTTGAKWSERIWGASGVTRLSYDPAGHLIERATLDARGRETDGPVVHWNERGTVVAEGSDRHGRPVGAWREYDDSGAPIREALYDQDGRLVSETRWNAAHVKTQERLPNGAFAEYYASGAARYQRKPDGSATRWYENGQRSEETKRVGDEELLVNAWGEDGKQLVRDGDGVRPGVDGELGTPWLVTYRQGRAVAHKVVGPPLAASATKP
jgi:hypothetical protein